MGPIASPAPVQATIFVLTCLFIGKDRGTMPPTPKVDRTRTWGWYPSFDLATQAAMDNDGDMYEMGYYNAVVIEEYPCGTMELPVAEHWFMVDYDPSREYPYDVAPIAKRPALESIVSFAW